jgi:hypothetical protein
MEGYIQEFVTCFFDIWCSLPVVLCSLKVDSHAGRKGERGGGHLREIAVDTCRTGDCDHRLKGRLVWVTVQPMFTDAPKSEY